MILGMSTFTFIHTIISVVALVAGIVVIVGLFSSRSFDGWTALYLATAIATSATGFFLPSGGFGASQWVGVISLVALGLAVLALYVFHLAGAWRWIYAVGVVVGLYFLVFVAVVQAFRKVPALHALAPTESELPFALTQVVILLIFVVLAVASARTFHRPTASGV
jgi:hypothetical protein